MAPERVTHVVESFEPHGGVVVGDDGSPQAAAAVRYAAEEARRRGAVLHVIRAWTMATAARPGTWRPDYVPPLAEFEAATLAQARAHVDTLLGPEGSPERQGPEVQLHVVHGPAASALLTASRTADVMVVGSRGRGGFAELVLGSVADQCIRHSICPVVVVRHRARSAHA
jgi:nucleotide-binding universal stress UspA family protein